MVVSIHECGEGAEEKMVEKLKKILCVRWRTGSVAKSLLKTGVGEKNQYLSINSKSKISTIEQKFIGTTSSSWGPSLSCRN